MAQYFEQIMQSINNSEIRVALEKLFAITGIGKGSAIGSGGGEIVADVTGSLTGNVTGNVTGTLVGAATKQVVTTKPQNALNAVGILTWDTFATIGDTITIGTREYIFVADGTKAADGEIDIGAATAADSQAEIVAAIAGDGVSAVNTDVVISAFDAADAAFVTAITPGAAGVAIATVTVPTTATNKFTAATLLGGTDGTIAEAGTVILAGGYRYTTIDGNDLNGKNWKVQAVAPYIGANTSYEVIGSVVDLGETDFESDTIFLSGAAACTVVDWTPTPGVTYILHCSESTNNPVVTLTSGITINAAGNDKMTFPDADDTIVLKCLTATRLVVLSNDGGVTLATA